MKLGGRLAAAIEVIDDIDKRHRPVAGALRDWGLSHRFAGSGDRAAIGNLVYDVYRWRASTAWTMAEETPRALVLGVAATRWGLGTDALDAAIADDPHAPAPLTANERNRLAGGDLSTAPDWVRADIPEWLGSRFADTLGPAWVEEGVALAGRPPLDLRVNRLKATRDKVLKALLRFSAEATRLAPEGIRIPPTHADRRHPNVQAEQGFRRGWFEVQDEGSQLAACLAGAKAGEQVLDLCAGAGGKTLALAAMMENKGQIHATDADRMRLAPIVERLKRAGTRNVQVLSAGNPLDGLAGRMDLVLIDAPCTGTGVWRRRPEIKWRLTEKAIADRVAEQAALLDQAAPFVRPGGRLVYVTCSLLPDENEARVAAFLERTGEFALVDPLALWRDTIGGEPPEGSVLTIGEAGQAIRLTPANAGTDGFFVAVMQKSGEGS